MRYRLRTLLILLAVLPPLLAACWFNIGLAIVMLVYCPYFAFLIWQIRLRSTTRE